MPLTFEQRIRRIEQAAIEKGASGNLPGTQITRTLHPEEGHGMQWTVAIGGLQQPKRFFVHGIIEGALDMAEEWLGIQRHYITCDDDEVRDADNIS